MSNKLHFAHTWQVHYTSEETFNLDSVQFKELMKVLDINCFYDDDEFADDMECMVDDWKSALERLRNYPYIPENDCDAIEKALAMLTPKPSVQELNEYLTRIYTNSDTEDGYIHISFF